ncbi:hypothetical protein KCV87_32300 [Actinosynnema pretiosum subsp. pretiosum]|uniref:HNH endonuclease 5 domain-containing protein n=1 Tax=Actinosynnema pretiosum subsp. pretiosum TaxID=103721 RepID=A0AA45L6Z8_9PSEU|nr:Phage protein [Actinosynnema pretiosum subsp. pretiosum]QUF03985.1 hypothetical protein KCV87_32300 [Actinosynnema pretiosum subsp. pretiosum]
MSDMQANARCAPVATGGPTTPPGTHRGTTNRNLRGSAADRRVRRAWLVAMYGDGEQVLCFECRVALSADTLSVDRVVPGALGGTYHRSNIRPMCLRCNSRAGGVLVHQLHSGKAVTPPLAVGLVPVLVAVRCHPSGQRTYRGARLARVVDELARLGLVAVAERRRGVRVVTPVPQEVTA